MFDNDMRKMFGNLSSIFRSLLNRLSIYSRQRSDIFSVYDRYIVPNLAIHVGRNFNNMLVICLRYLLYNYRSIFDTLFTLLAIDWPYHFHGWALKCAITFG